MAFTLITPLLITLPVMSLPHPTFSGALDEDPSEYLETIEVYAETRIGNTKLLHMRFTFRLGLTNRAAVTIARSRAFQILIYIA